MRHPVQDQRLLGFIDGGRADRAAAVPAGLALEARLAGQGVDQPRLAPRQLPDPPHRTRLEHLPRLRFVLAQQRAAETSGSSTERPGWMQKMGSRSKLRFLTFCLQ